MTREDFMTRKERVQVMATPALIAWLGERAEMMTSGASAGQQAAVELAMWREHLAAELRATTWTLPEIGCITDVLNRPIVDASIGARVAYELEDAFEDTGGAYGATWGIDEADLLAKVGRLGPTGNHALISAVHQWWATDAEHTREGWATVGVRVAPGGGANEIDAILAGVRRDAERKYGK